MSLDYLPGYKQAQSGASPYLFCFCSVKPLEEVGHIIRGDADALVGNPEQEFAVLPLGLDCHLAAGITELDGVAEEIENHLPQPVSVNLHFRKVIRDDFF